MILSQVVASNIRQAKQLRLANVASKIKSVHQKVQVIANTITNDLLREVTRAVDQLKSCDQATSTDGVRRQVRSKLPPHLRGVEFLAHAPSGARVRDRNSGP